MKKLLAVVVVLVVLVAIAGVAVFVYMDSIATTAVKKAMAYATQCEVEVGQVDVKPMAGEAVISDLDIKNPTDFQSIHESFLKLETGEAGVSLGTLRSDRVEVPKVVIDGVELSLIGRDGKTNYETILESLKRLQGEEAPDDTAADGKEFIIRTVEITNVKVYVDMDEDPATGLLPVQFDEPITLKPITLTDVGKGGVPLSQISADLITDILVQVVAQLGNQLGDRVLSGLTSGLTGILGEDALQGQLTAITSALGLESIDVGNQLGRAAELGTAVFEGLGDGAGQAVEGARDAIGGAIDGVLGGGDDDDEEGGSVGDNLRGILGGDDE
ncbi:MAG: AsmA family protein [Phycisphaerales bacterium JB063]